MPVAPPSGEALDAISNEIVRLKVEYYGKGPEEAKTFFNDNVVMCMLTGGLTTVEQTLVKAGKQDLVRTVRLTFEDLMADKFQGVIERVTGRRVLTYHSQILFDPVRIFEIFVLE